MTDLSNLTIIIPSYNRHDYILRNMTFWSSTNVNLHVFDGSKSKIEDFDNLNFPSNIHYHHYPVSFAERISIAASFIKTKYAVLLGDDDMFLKSGLAACIDELESNDKIISCIGRSMSFYCENEILRGDLEYKEMKNYEVSDDDSFDRMIFHMNPYCCSILYSVIRTDHWKKAASLISLSVFPDPGVVELQFELSICFLGKSKVIPSLMWLRSYENPSLYNGDQVPFSKWWTDINYAQLKNELLTNFTSILNSGYLHDNEYVKIRLNDAYNEYVKWANAFIAELNILDRIILWIKRTLKNIISSYIKNDFKHSAIKLSQNGVRIDHQELDEFISLILKFHKK